MHTPSPRPIHPFPARMASSIPWEELQSDHPLVVLDPMVGSGTTVAIARALGHRAIGFDIDPLAVELAKAWCSSHTAAVVRAKAFHAASEAQSRWSTLRGHSTYPKGADEETRAFVRYWFDLTNRRQLRALADAIETVAPQGVRRILWVAFSRLIIAKEAGASRARDLAHSRPHRVEKPPTRALPAFLGEVERIITALASATHTEQRGVAEIAVGDARQLPTIETSSVDVVITSPPYLNAIDYLRTSKFSLVWMGHGISNLRTIRSRSIGSEVSAGANIDRFSDVMNAMGRVATLPSRQRLLLSRYLEDMDRALREFSRVLVPGGRAILVVGDCAVRGVRIRNSIGLEALARRHGLAPGKHTRRTIPANRRYLPPPSSAVTNLEQRMRSEVVLRFTKISHPREDCQP